MTVLMGMLFLAALGLSTALICPDGGMCEDKNTCCKNTEGGYGCCPLPRAECCSDHLHCCYEGTLCDLVHGKCVNKTVSLPWMRRLPAKDVLRAPQLSEKVKAVICPDQKSECPDETTCCQLPDGSWGCCPLPNAACCEDKRHCCPQGTKCDLVHSKCVSGSLESFPMMEKLPASRRENKPTLSTGESVMCPGGKSSCPNGFTCCQLTRGDYGCCPYPQAMCCSDHIHCCPSNTTCDLDHQVCKSGEKHLPLLKKIPAVPSDIVCQDKSVCPDQTTCCQLVDGSYGCCPMPNAVCCSDHSHCCPAGARCDPARGMCVSAQGDSPMVRKIPAAVTEPVETLSKVASVPCNDSVACADRNTCCKDPTGEWACCPLPKAVCCEDHLHCCPHGTICNLAASTCDDPTGGTVMPWLNKVPSFPLLSDNRKCDESSLCPGESTCCTTTSGAWACCPLPQAVCCSDRQHCCPEGYECNVAARTCDRPGDQSLPWLQKAAALQVGPDRAASLAHVAENTCDSQTSCPKDTTCCFMSKAHKWGCCPLPNAVCCNDGNNCCPSGHTCEPHRSSCSKGPQLIPWFSKRSARTEPGALTDVKCDNKSSCATGTTCCKLQKGDWGCCPLVKAVCCADHEHCCPHDYTCNMETGTCEKKNHNVPVCSLLQSKAVPSKPRDDRDVPCDGTGTFHCSEHDTCCKASASEWACCPLPRAVCCPDSRHCCPAGYSCDPKAGGCSLKTQLMWDTWFEDRKRHVVPHGL